MEKNVAKHVLADVLWVTHQSRGHREAKAIYDLLKRSYRARQLDWHEECLQLAWEQYRHWVSSGSANELNDFKRKGHHNKKPSNLAYPIRLEKRGRNEWEFAWPGEVLNLSDKFDLGIDYLEAGDIKKARRIFKSLLSECPYFIDALNHLAVTEWDTGNLVAAEDYYTKAYNVGRSVLPADFKGKLPWYWTDNRPYLRTVHGLALVKLRRGDLAGAKELLDRLLKLDPDDHLGVRMLLEDIKNGTVPWDE
ncbi:tetratricopeptide repeat protein [Desulfotruncus alcoholivorax]|uniref:tetratricopeptide repeat protein n=1 Tax=Desulfotruncus alcoholivorax TaxID=265477 RepID=UPI0004190D5A|nr:tetratricopeptide repeat protein [Desulfotruncus alcoholivorax]